MNDLIFDPGHLDATPTRVQRTSSHDSTTSEVVEVPLLLPGWQVSVLEREAHDRGLTAGEMVRHVLRDFLATLPVAPAKCRRPGAI